MKTIENISPVLEKILLKGLSETSPLKEINVMSSCITLFFLDDKLFLFFKKKNPYTNTSLVSLYEIGLNESSFLSVALDAIVLSFDFLDEDSLNETKKFVFEKVVSFCSEVSFPCKEIEFYIK